MKREIKFRAWDERGQQIIDNEELQMNCDGFAAIDEEGTEFPMDVIMQYTGLKDRNGKEIYEGDIIKCTVTENSADYLQIEAGDKHSVLRIILIPDLYQEGLSDDGEIIGNIYENPELIKETK